MRRRGWERNNEVPGECSHAVVSEKFCSALLSCKRRTSAATSTSSSSPPAQASSVPCFGEISFPSSPDSPVHPSPRSSLWRKLLELSSSPEGDPPRNSSTARSSLAASRASSLSPVSFTDRSACTGGEMCGHKDRHRYDTNRATVRGGYPHGFPFPRLGHCDEGLRGHCDEGLRSSPEIGLGRILLAQA